ncbi:hypothetical protein [Rhizobium leguminosarum]
MSTTTPDDRISTYNPVVATTQFAAGFPVFDNADIGVTVDGVERFDFTVTATYAAGISTDAKAVFSPGIVGDVVVFGKRAPRRSSRFLNGSPLSIPDQNLALDTLEAEVQEAARDVVRAHKAPFGEDGGVFSAADIGNAQANAESAQASADLAEKWAENPRNVAVEPGHFSSKHWAEVAAESASTGVAGVSSFNGRPGIVVPLSGDYSSAQVGRGAGTVEDALDAIEADIAATKGTFLASVVGLTVQANAGAPSTSIDISAGEYHRAGKVAVNASTLVKRIDANWAVGSGNGGLDTGTKQASTTYFVFAIRSTTTGVFEGLISASPSAPTVPAGYELMGRVGICWTNASSNLIAQKQVGSKVTLNAAITSFTGGATSATALINAGGPVGVSVDLLMNLSTVGTGPNADGSLILWDGNAGSASEGPGNRSRARATAAGEIDASLSPDVPIRTLANGQIYRRADTVGTFTYTARISGWIDYQVPRVGA